MNHLGAVDSRGSSDSQRLVIVSIKGEPLQLLVDTSSEVSVIPKSVFVQLGFRDVGMTDAVLTGYSGKKIRL